MRECARRSCASSCRAAARSPQWAPRCGAACSALAYTRLAACIEEICRCHLRAIYLCFMITAARFPNQKEKRCVCRQIALKKLPQAPSLNTKSKQMPFIMGTVLKILRRA